MGDGGAVTFDANGDIAGSDISHTAGSGDVTISATGTYYVQFSANVAPTGTTTYPAADIATISLNGQTLNGGAGTAQFSSASDSRHMTAATIVNVTDAPATVSVVSSGGQFLYTGATINVYKI